MFEIKWASMIVLLGFLFATPTLAGLASIYQETDGKPSGDHHSLALYYEEQAQQDGRMAEEWEFLANHHANFPQEVGALNADEHIARCRAMAEDFRNLQKWHHKLALKHLALMRKDIIP